VNQTRSLAGRSPHVLIITFAYEPLAHVSPTRPSWMGRELTKLGWEVSVLTVDWSHPLPAAIPSIEESVARALDAQSPRMLAIDGRLSDPAFDPLAIPRTTEPRVRNAAIRKLRTAWDAVGWGPYAGWARHAFRAARMLHQRAPLDVTWAIHGDASTHAIASALHATEGVPWVADYKDPWSLFHPPVLRPLVRWATARRLRTAAAMTETCAAQAELDAREFARSPVVVYSGYDDEMMARSEPERPGPGFCVTYLGTLNPQHETRLLADVFLELGRRGVLDRADVTLHQYARPSDQLAQLLAPVGLDSIVRSHDWVSRARSFSLMRGSDVLLLFTSTRGTGTLKLGVKELEYFASGTPVLVLGEPLDELKPVIASCPQVAVATREIEAADFLETEACRCASGTSPSKTRMAPNAPVLEPFSWKRQAERLAAVLDGARSRRPGRES